MEIRNAFHATKVRVYPRPDGTISARARARAIQALCGIPGCKCLGSGASSQEARVLVAAIPNDEGRYAIAN